MKKQKNYEKGITLIALVITIIVLLILAGVTLRIVFNGGIISKSQTAADKYTEESAREKLSVAVLSYKMGTLTGEAGEIEGKKHLNEYIEEINGQLSEAEDSKYYEVELDGYLFWVDKETLEIISQGPSKAEPPTEIKFSADNSNEVNIGETLIFKLELTPPKASKKFLKWSVDNEEIATIKNGVLTGKQEGTVKVKVTSTSTEGANVKASCTVTVKSVELTGITLNKTNVTMNIDDREKLEISFEPTNASNKDVEWSSSNDAVAKVEQDGTIQAISGGKAVIKVESKENSDIYKECTVIVQQIIEISTVEELKTFEKAVNAGDAYIGKKVILKNDLNLNKAEWTAIGTESTPFSGSFDGQGHTISGLYINKTSKLYQGFFGYVEGESSIIENLILENVNITGSSNTGGIAGYITNTTINKCMVSGNITRTWIYRIIKFK